MPRITLPERESLTPELQRRWDRMAERGPVNVQRIFFASPGVAFNPAASVRASGLDEVTREILILRCAWLKKAIYEWHQHVRFSRELGIPDAKIDAVRNWQQADCFSETEQALMSLADAMAASTAPSEAVFQAVAKGRPEHELIAIIFTIAHYFALADVLSVVDINTEEPFVGWHIVERGPGS